MAKVVKKVVKPRKLRKPADLLPAVDPAQFSAVKKWASINVAELSTEELEMERTRIVVEKQAIEYEREPLPMHRVPKKELLKLQATRAAQKDRLLQLLADLSLVNLELKRRNVIQSGIRDQVQHRILQIAYAIFVGKDERAVPLMRTAIRDLLGTGWSPKPLLDLPEPGNER